MGNIENLEIISGFEDEKSILELFDEYTKMLVGLDESFGLYLTIQHYDQEIRDLHIKYGWPRGRLYLAKIDGQPAGCIALRPLSDTVCELKRLYIKPEFRGRHLADILLKRILKEAAETGYSLMKLDTLDELKEALGLYHKYDFRFCDCYNESPSDTTLFMEKGLLDLQPEASSL